MIPENLDITKGEKPEGLDPVKKDDTNGNVSDENIYKVPAPTFHEQIDPEAEIAQNYFAGAGDWGGQGLTYKDFGESSYDYSANTFADLEDLNEVRAREQLTLTKLTGGLGRFGIETVNTAVGNIVGIVVGIGQGIYNSFDDDPNTTFWNGLWNNEITRIQESIREWQDKAMPNYRSKAEQNMGPLRSIFTASGFADLMSQAGFTSGILLSTWLTGGMGVGSGAASLLKMAGASEKTVNFAYRLISGIMGSASEASMEGLNNYNEVKNHYTQEINSKYDNEKDKLTRQINQEVYNELIKLNPSYATLNPQRNPELENSVREAVLKKYEGLYNDIDERRNAELQNIEARALSAGSMTFGLNMAILGFSNTLGALSFLKAPSVNTERQISKGLLSPLFRRKAATEAAEAPLGEGISKWEARAIGIREGLSEGFEESNQKWASNLAEQYYASDYDPEAKNKFSRFLETAGETFKTTYSDPETWKEFLMGAITGFGGTFNVAGVAKLISGQKVKASDFWQGGVIEAWREGTALAERSQKAYNEMNKLITDKKLQDNFRLGTFMLASRERQIEAAARGDKLAYENENDAQTLRMIQTFANAGELNTLSALVGRNENLSDEELNALVEGLTERNEEKYGDNKYHSDYSYLLTENGERISDILDKDDPRRKEAKEKIAKESKRIQDMIKSYQQAINKADSKTGYSLGVEELNLHAWGMVQADRADERMKEIIDKRLDVLKSIKPSQSYISENAVKSIDKTVKQLEKELARENKKPDSEEKTKNVEALNRSIESLNRYKETGENNNIVNDIFQSLLSEGNASVIAGWLNTKISDDRYIADEILESLDDNGLLNDDLKRDINDVVRLFKARHNYDQLVNEWAQNPQEVIDLMDRQAKVITDRYVKDLAEKFNEEFKNANIRSVKDFKYKLPRILKKLGITDAATLQAVNQKAGQTNRDLVLYGNSIAYQNLLKDRVSKLEGADDKVKQIANDLLDRKDILYQKIKYANKNQIARLLTQGMRLSAELMEVAERAASLIYVAKEEFKQSQESTESDAKSNEAAQEDTVETNEETPPNASETPTSDSTATDPIPEHQNQQILQMEYDSEDWSNVQWEVASTLKSEEVDSLIKNLASIDDAIDPEAISIVNNLISQYSTCLVMSVKDKDFLAIADRIKNALTSFYQKANLPLAFIYDSVSNDKNEVETLFKSNSGLNSINIDFQDNDQVPDNVSLIAMVEVSEKQGFHQMNITVLRGKQTQQPIEVKAKDEDGLETQIEVEDSESTQTEETQEEKEENPEQFSEDSENKQDLVTTEQTFVGETTVESQNIEEAEQEVEETEEELTELPPPPADVMPIVAGEENQTEQKREEKEIPLDDVSNLFSLQDIDTNQVTIKAYEKPWKNNPNKSNKTLRIYLKGQEDKGYFELVKDEEYGYYSVHFKTATDNPNAKYNAENTTISTKEERNILFKQLANAIPNGSKVSTWGSISPEGLKAIDKLGKLFNGKVVEHRTIKSKVDNSDVSIPVYQKGEEYSWGRTSENSYEVSTAGDKRFSALNAKFAEGTIINGTDVSGMTIEEVYQKVIKKSGKGKAPAKDSILNLDRIESNGESSWIADGTIQEKLPAELWHKLYGIYAGNYTVSEMPEPEITNEDKQDFSYYVGYLPLWQEWAKQNPELMSELREKAKGKVLTDKFAKTQVSQARALAEILNTATEETNREQSEAPKVEQPTQQQPVQTPTPKRKSEFGHTIATVKRPKTEVTQNAVVWADSFKYAEPEKGSIDFETEKAINEMLLPLFKESDTYNYIYSGKLAEFLRNNPDAPLYVKALPIKVNGKNPTSTASYVFGLYVKDNGKYILVGYKERGLSASKRSDYAITNNMYDAIFEFDQHYPEAYYNNNELVTTATNIEFIPTKNDDGYYTFTNKEGKPFAINKIAATPVPQTPNRRRPTSDVKVGNKSLEQAYNDGEIMLGFNWGKGKKLTLTGKGNPVETTSKITNTGGVIVAFKGSDGELTQCGVVGRALSSDLIDRNSDNSIVKAIVSEIDKLQKALNDKNTDRAKEIIIKQLSKYVFTRNWNIKSTKNGISISIARTTGNLTADINFSATFDDIVNSLVKLQSIFSANVTESTKLYDFLALSETIITNFESPAKLLIGFVNEPIDEHNMNVNRKNEKKGQAIKLGDYFVRMFLENGKFVVEPLEESSKKSQKDIATLLGLNVSKQQVGIVSTTVNTILLDIANKFANKEIIEIENIDGDIVRCVYYPKTDNTIETLVDVDTNQCIDVSKDNVLSANLKEVLEEREEKNDDAVLTSMAQEVTVSEQQIEDKIAENKEEKVVEVQTVKPEEIKAETKNKPKNTRKSVTSEREKVARRSEAGGEEVVRKKRRGGLDFSEAEDVIELPDNFYETMYQAELEEAETYFSLAKADNIRSRFNRNRDISIGNILLNIANSDSPYAAFAKELSERLGTLKTLRIVLHPEVRNDNGQMVSGRYTSADNTIAIAANAMSSNEKLDRCVLHEILHAIVYNTVNKDQAKMYEISRIFENVKRELLKKYGYTSFEDLKQDSDSGKVDLKYDLYGLTNLDEFISEIFTNPRFIKEVNSIDKSFLSKFINWVKSLFTKPLSDQIQSRLKDILNNFNTNINTSTNYQNSAKAYHEDVRDKVLDEIKRVDAKLSTVNFVTNLTKKANEDGTVNTLLSKLQEVNASETRENLADLIRYISSFANTNINSMSDSKLIEKYYDVLAGNEVDTLFSNIAETLKLCKDPDFILSLRRNSNIQENNDVNSKINSNFASILEQQNNKCN